MARGPLLRLPKAALDIIREAARLVLRRPVIGVAGAARTSDGKWILIRRADTGRWALPGGTMEWGETIVESLEREFREETGIRGVVPKGLVGVFSRPDRDVRFHGVTVLVACDVERPAAPPANPLEILEVGLFDDDEIPTDLEFGGMDMIRAARAGGPPILE